MRGEGGIDEERNEGGKEGIGGKRSEGGKEGETGKGKVKIMFWNVAGIDSKDTEVWEYLEKFDFIGLTET